jgi:Carboxylesterase family
MYLPGARHLTRGMKHSVSVPCSSRLLQSVECCLFLVAWYSGWQSWLSVGDISFQSQRRFWSKYASNHDVKHYAYLFTQPQPKNPPALGGRCLDTFLCDITSKPHIFSVAHATEIFFIYGSPPDNSTSAITLGEIMVDYWISFATSLDPNDGHGHQRMSTLTIFIFNSVAHELHVLQVRNGVNTPLLNR